jgi:L-alanine-DL-glutamate epimerase-like enolase superfamily enzyme
MFPMMPKQAQSAVPIPSLHIQGVEALVFRAPIATPVQTSFGIMHDRPACMLRAMDVDGLCGWGEVWCNFPSVGAEHRARLALACVAPLVMAQPWDHPAQAFARLTEQLHVLALQSGEAGPIAQVIAGLDIALWDLAAKKAQTPLWRLLKNTNLSNTDSEIDAPTVQVYASGLNPTAPEKLAAQCAQNGYTAFKPKVGFGQARDEANLHALRETLGDDVRLMVDANQAWSVEEAIRMSHVLAPFDVQWLEEPVLADLPWSEWTRLAKQSAIPLAAGENLRGDAQFDHALASGALRVVQPDLAKWGGFTACVPLGHRIEQRGAWFCPHWLGGGVGLAATLHLKAAVGCISGMVEIDANPNPLRTLFAYPLNQVKQGVCTLSHVPGLGIEPDLNAVKPLLVWQQATGDMPTTF